MSKATLHRRPASTVQVIKPATQIERLEDRTMFSAYAVSPVEAPPTPTVYVVDLGQIHATARPVAIAARAAVTPATTHVKVTAVQSDDATMLVGFCSESSASPFSQGWQGVTGKTTGRLHRDDEQSFAGRPPMVSRNQRPALGSVSVLIVEDDPTTRTALSMLLKRQGFKVSTASTVQEGITRLATRPDHVIVDLQLPDGPGEKVLQAARQSGLATSVTIMTGVSDPQRLAQIAKLKPNSVLSKPINIGALVQRLKSVQ